jgi:hypothetical protein
MLDKDTPRLCSYARVCQRSSCNGAGLSCNVFTSGHRHWLVAALADDGYAETIGP